MMEGLEKTDRRFVELLMKRYSVGIFEVGDGSTRMCRLVFSTADFIPQDDTCTFICGRG